MRFVRTIRLLESTDFHRRDRRLRKRPCHEAVEIRGPDQTEQIILREARCLASRPRYSAGRTSGDPRRADSRGRCRSYTRPHRRSMESRAAYRASLECIAAPCRARARRNSAPSPRRVSGPLELPPSPEASGEDMEALASDLCALKTHVSDAERNFAYIALIDGGRHAEHSERE